MEHRRTLLVTRGVLLLFWLSVITLVLRSIHDSPLRLGPRWVANLVAITPEGWAFFTRDPQERTQHAYRRAGSTWVRAIPTNADPRYLFGIKRSQRTHEIELGLLIGQVPAKRWVSGRSTVRGPVDQSIGPAVLVENRARRPTLCGDFVVQRRESMPWAWARSRETVGMPSTSVALHVRCGRTPPPVDDPAPADL
jgi:antimicrobial peptide system SdpA family protein